MEVQDGRGMKLEEAACILLPVFLGPEQGASLVARDCRSLRGGIAPLEAQRPWIRTERRACNLDLYFAREQNGIAELERTGRRPRRRRHLDSIQSSRNAFRSTDVVWLRTEYTSAAR
uniref:Uncharacterized protein n=1 Tax=Mycena chlorophos TaxID=658473 RepID=A0ABQ0MAR4_MYCCL|nr:predicted protein [Mycena chlorophos]